MNDNKMDLSTLEEMFLRVLSTQELYGLEIIKAIEQATGGKRRIGFGSLYPTLHKLEKKRFVVAHWGEDRPDERGGARRKYYKISGAGQAALRDAEQIRVNLTQCNPAMGRA